MAFLACHDSVAPDQRKSRDIVVEGCNATPIVLAMASVAANAKLAVVPIVLAMASHAHGRQLVSIEIASVAAVALDLCVGGPEWKFGVRVVIKADRDPLVLFVAGSALGAVPPSVDVLNSVAIDARGPNFLVAFAHMARRAGDIAVRTLQRKSGLAVVERLCATPCGLAMAIVTRLPKTSLMRIVCLMTIEAAPGGVAKLRILRVTTAAWHGFVGIPKLKIR